MNRLSITWCFLVVLVWSVSLRGQQSRVESRASGRVKVVQFGKGLEIHQTEATGKYIALRVGPKNTMGQAMYVFDRDGNVLFTKGRDGTEDIQEVALSDSLGYVIKVDLRYKSYEAYDRNATAYDIKTGRETWRTKLPYHDDGFIRDNRVSPDGMHMLNAGQSGPSPILNLTDGSNVDSRRMLDVVGADWLDNERIVVAKQQLKFNPAAKPYAEESHMRGMELDSLVYLRLRQRAYLDRGDITKEEYEARRAELTKRIDEIRRKQAADGERGHPPATLLAVTKLMIYNIRTAEIEFEKDIFAPDGEPIVVSAGAGGEIGVINVERATGSIYVFANKNEIDPASYCIVKLDKNLNIRMFASIFPGPLFKLNIEGSVQFVVQKDNSNYLLDNDTGKLTPVRKLATKAGDFSLDLDPLWLTTRTFVRGINTNDRSGSVEFSLTEEERP